MKSIMLRISALLLCLAIKVIVCPPVDPSQKMKPATQEEAKQEEDLGLEYGKYLQQVVQILEQDKDFAKKLENVSADDIKSGKVAKELEFVNHGVRSKLDELKRIELDRLRSLVRQEIERNELGIDRNMLGADLKHLDYNNPHTFEVEDLKKLIKTASIDLDNLNARRKEEFKEYELEKEHHYRESLKNLTEEEKKVAEAKHTESQKRHLEHPKVHHPGSKQQLEQVWEEQDNLPKQEFNPSTFFAMHDVNGDGYWDEEEVEAILSLEIKKMYEANNSDDDPVEMMEEYHRMREHIYNETDTNKDGLISKQEFMDMTKKAEFNQDEGWKGLDEERVYTDEELAQYEEHLRQLAMSQYQYAQGGPQYHPDIPQGYHPDAAVPPHYPPQGQFQQHPQQGGQFQQPPHQGGQYQQHPQQGGQYQQHPPQQGGQFQQHPPQQGGQYQQHPPQQGGQYQQHPPQQGGQFQQPPHQGGQFQQPPPQQGGQFQQPPPQQGGQFQQPPPQQGGQFQQHNPQQGGGQFQQPAPQQGGQGQAQQPQVVSQQVPIQASSNQPAVVQNAGHQQPQGSTPNAPVSNQPSSQQQVNQRRR